MKHCSRLHAVTYIVKVVVSKKWRKIGTLLLQTTNRKYHMAYRFVPFPVTWMTLKMNVVELFKCNSTNFVRHFARFQLIQVTRRIARSISNSWVSCIDNKHDLPWQNFRNPQFRTKVEREIPFLEIPKFPYNTVKGKLQAKNQLDSSVGFNSIASRSKNSVIQLHTHVKRPFVQDKATWVSRYQKGKTNLDFTEAIDSEWQWHQLGYMQVCTSLQTAIPIPHHSVFYRSDALSAAQPTASKHRRQLSNSV